MNENDVRRVLSEKKEGFNVEAGESFTMLNTILTYQASKRSVLSTVTTYQA